MDKLFEQYLIESMEESVGEDSENVKKTETPKMKYLLYIKEGRQRVLYDEIKDLFVLQNKKSKHRLNGKIVASFYGEVKDSLLLRNKISKSRFDEEAEEITKTQNHTGSTIHIENLEILDKPMKLGESKIYNYFNQLRVTKEPRNMMRVYGSIDDQWDEYILISIRPELACKILNGNSSQTVKL